MAFYMGFEKQAKDKFAFMCKQAGLKQKIVAKIEKRTAPWGSHIDDVVEHIPGAKELLDTKSDWHDPQTHEKAKTLIHTIRERYKK